MMMPDKGGGALAHQTSPGGAVMAGLPKECQGMAGLRPNVPAFTANRYSLSAHGAGRI